MDTGEQTQMNVVLDACVLAGSIRRHVLCMFAAESLFTPVWSSDILRETEFAIPKTLPADAETPEDHAYRVCELLRKSFPQAQHAYTPLPTLAGLPDPHDMHVISLAISSESGLIITENLKDFPPKLLATQEIARQSTDAFLSNLALQYPKQAASAIDRLLTSIDLPDIDREIILLRMQQTGLKKTVRALKKPDSFPLRQSGASLTGRGRLDEQHD